MSHTAKLRPNLDQESKKVLNLTVLQRIDPFVEEILITAAHVALYEFNIEKDQWSRKDIEGTLFVVKRNTQPRFQFIVMNRRSTVNFVENLLGEFEYEVQVPYLLYRNAAQEVNGIWFYNQHECEEIANLFGRILGAFSTGPPKPKVSSTKSKEFEELEAVLTLAVMEDRLEPSASSTSAAPDGLDDSFSNFFSVAMNMGPTTSKVANAEQLHGSSSALSSSSSYISSVMPSSVSALQRSSHLPNSLSSPIMTLLQNPDSIIKANRVASLVKPISFISPKFSSSSFLMMPPTVSSSMPLAGPPLHPQVSLQHQYGTHWIQPFPPPTSHHSFTQIPPSGPIITREKVHDALTRLCQVDDLFKFLLYCLHTLIIYIAQSTTKSRNF